MQILRKKSTRVDPFACTNSSAPNKWPISSSQNHAPCYFKWRQCEDLFLSQDHLGNDQSSSTKHSNCQQFHLSLKCNRAATKMKLQFRILWQRASRFDWRKWKPCLIQGSNDIVFDPGTLWNLYSISKELIHYLIFLIAHFWKQLLSIKASAKYENDKNKEEKIM